MRLLTYTYNNGIVKFKSSVLGNRSLKISNNGKSLIEDKFAFNKNKVKQYLLLLQKKKTAPFE